jgi:hypothetical protein
MGEHVKLNLGSGAHPVEGFDNLDLPSWEWGNALPYGVESVEAVTISHALMYCKPELLFAVLADIWRVLVPSGIVRITEDDTFDPASERFGGAPDARLLTGIVQMSNALRSAGFIADWLMPDQTNFGDTSLIQRWHGEPPKIFHIEGIKP